MRNPKTKNKITAGNKSQNNHSSAKEKPLSGQKRLYNSVLSNFDLLPGLIDHQQDERISSITAKILKAIKGSYLTVEDTEYIIQYFKKLLLFKVSGEIENGQK